MPKMIVKQRAEIVDEFDLNSQQDKFTIGSDNRNDLVVSDQLVSMNHAVIERTGQRYVIRDLQSAFGTFVNGERLEEATELRNGDHIGIGEHSIVFDNPLENVDVSFFQPNGATSLEEQPNGQPEQSQQQKLDEFETKLRRESLTLLRQGSEEKTETLPYHLLAIYGPYSGKRYQLQRHETKIGRDENLNDIVLKLNGKGQPDQSVSRRHATVIYKDGSFFVTDKRSKTRTYVNRVVVPEDGEVELFVNDEIEIVSDQQSTIFRLVEEGESNFAPPKKAGVWWVRYQSRFATAAAAALALLGIYLAFAGFQEYRMLTQRPAPLQLNLAYWATDRSPSVETTAFGSGQQDKVFRLVPVVADFNGDGVVDIITTNVTNKPLLIDGKSKQPKWIIDTLPASDKSALLAADLNENQLNDLVYITDDGRVAAIDGQYGAEIWVSQFFDKQLTGPPVVDDFDGDGLNDVAVADIAGDIHVGYNQIMSMDWATITTGIPISSPLASADLDKDGDSEIVCGSERGIVFILDGQNRNILGTIDINEEMNQALGSMYEDNQIRYPVGVADLNGDQKADLLITTVQGRIVAIDGSTRRRLWHDVLTTELTLKTDHPFPFALGDFDGDGLFDVVTGSAQGEIRAYSGKGSHQNAKVLWKRTPEKPSPIYQSFVVGDINKDRVSDVIYTDEASMLWVLDGKSGDNLLGSPEATTPEASMPLAADLESDGFLDLLLATRSGIIFQFKSNCQIPRATVVWGQEFGQNQNTVRPNFELPKTTQAGVSMLAGLLLFFGSGALRFLLRKRAQPETK